jgi:Na+/proline symporter
MLGLTWLQTKYLGEVQTSEQFMAANRSVKTGLVASAIVSSWTWAATLLQSSAVAYKFGVSGPFWYASGATIQVLLFAILAVEVKIKAPNAHTFAEIMQARYGKATHIIFLCFGLACNIVVTAMLLLGGSAVVVDLTGMNLYASCASVELSNPSCKLESHPYESFPLSLLQMLIPVGVMIVGYSAASRFAIDS